MPVQTKTVKYQTAKRRPSHKLIRPSADPIAKSIEVEVDTKGATAKNESVATIAEKRLSLHLRDSMRSTTKRAVKANSIPLDENGR